MERGNVHVPFVPRLNEDIVTVWIVGTDMFFCTDLGIGTVLVTVRSSVQRLRSRYPFTITWWPSVTFYVRRTRPTLSLNSPRNTNLSDTQDKDEEWIFDGIIRDKYRCIDGDEISGKLLYGIWRVMKRSLMEMGMGLCYFTKKPTLVDALLVCLPPLSKDRIGRYDFTTTDNRRVNLIADMIYIY